MKHIIIALSPKGFGETILGLRLASELVERGDCCHFITHESSVPLFTDPRFDYITINDRTLPLLGLLLQAQVKKIKPDSIILSDYFTTALSLERGRINPDIFRELECLTVAIDTWDIGQTGTKMDFVGNRAREFKDWTYLLDCLITPVPIAQPGNSGNYYSCLPKPIFVPKKVRRHIKRDLGIGEDQSIILFCSAEWQHTIFKTDEANQLRDRLPHLVAYYFKKLGSRVLLVHVGPRPFNLGLGDQYKWIPPLSPEQFDLLLSAADILLSANVSSTTISKALVSGIPIATLVNSFFAEDIQVRMSTKVMNPELLKWLHEPKSLHPFFLWPIGYYSFLTPIFKNNPYTESTIMLEISDEEIVMNTLNDLLVNPLYRQQVLEKQSAYVRLVQNLPSAAEALYNQVEYFFR